MAKPVDAIARRVPGVGLVRGCQKQWLRRDAVAGLVLAALLVPKVMAYAELAGLPAVTGPLHHDRLPGRLRDLRLVEGARPLTGLLGVVIDLRRHRATARHR